KRERSCRAQLPLLTSSPVFGGAQPACMGKAASMPTVLGINCFAHDTAAALVRDGRPVAFVEEERFNRDKHTKAFPDQAIDFCLREAGISIHEVDAIAFAHRAGVDYLRGLRDAVPRLPASAKRLAAQTYVDAMLVAKRRAFLR